MYLCLGKIQFTETYEKEQRILLKKDKLVCFLLFFNLNPFSSNNTPLYIVHVLGKNSLTIFVQCITIHFISLNLESNNWLFETCKVLYCTTFYSSTI